MTDNTENFNEFMDRLKGKKKLSASEIEEGVQKIENFFDLLDEIDNNDKKNTVLEKKVTSLFGKQTLKPTFE